jgi:RNA polymerase sigma factor (sigma-70 family)
MPTRGTKVSLAPLLWTVCAQDADGKTDGQLLQEFLAKREDAAFAALVRRHGPMVLGVCRRVLGNDTDAEDAFQAVFIVLMRKASALSTRAVLGDWLHGVARYTALKAKAATAQRKAKERVMAHRQAHVEEARNDWLPLLDEELSRLPERYRLPIVLCELECKTRREAAMQLGCPEGTVAGRLARGRDLLAKRLRRRAQIVAGVSLWPLAVGAAEAAMPLTLVQTTIQAAARVAAGRVTQGVLSGEALILAQGVIRSMLWQKIKFRASALLLAVLIAVAGGLTFHVCAGQEQPPNTAKPKPGELAASDQPPGKKATAARDEALVKAAEAVFEARWRDYKDGPTLEVNFLTASSVKLLKAQLRLSEKKSDKVAAYQAHLERMKALEGIAKPRFDAGVGGSGIHPGTQYQQVVYDRIEAEIWLDEARDAK